jgi:hypothetical protein
VPNDRPSRCLLELRFALAAHRVALRSLASALLLSPATQAARRAAAVESRHVAASMSLSGTSRSAPAKTRVLEVVQLIVHPSGGWLVAISHDRSTACMPDQTPIPLEGGFRRACEHNAGKICALHRALIARYSQCPADRPHILRSCSMPAAASADARCRERRSAAVLNPRPTRCAVFVRATVARCLQHRSLPPPPKGAP